MSEIQTAEIGTEVSSEFRQFGFQMFGLLELCTPQLSEIQTSSDFRHSLYVNIFLLIKRSSLVKNVRNPDSLKNGHFTCVQQPDLSGFWTSTVCIKT